MVQRQRLGVERSAAAVSHQRASPGPRTDRPSSAGDLLPEPLPPDVVAGLPQRVDPPPQLQQHPQLADRRLRVSLDAADAIRAEEPRQSPDEGHFVLGDWQIRAGESRDSSVLQRAR